MVHYFENDAGGPTATVEELVVHLDRRIPERDREELSSAIVHHQLPKLQSRGWLELDRRTGTVRYEGHESAGALLEDVAAVFGE